MPEKIFINFLLTFFVGRGIIKIRPGSLERGPPNLSTPKIKKNAVPPPIERTAKIVTASSSGTLARMGCARTLPFLFRRLRLSLVPRLPNLERIDTL